MSLFCLFVVLCLVMIHANITTNINFIPMLNDSNFKLWQENILIVLAVIDPDLTLMVNSPPPLANESTLNDKRDMQR